MIELEQQLAIMDTQNPKSRACDLVRYRELHGASAGEPISELTPAEFHLYQAGLEQLKVPDAKRAAAKARLLHNPNSKERKMAIEGRANGNMNPRVLEREGRAIDTNLQSAINSVLTAIGAIPERRLEPQLVSRQPEVVIFSRNR